MRSFKALAALLSYPEAPLIAALPELEDTLRGEGVVKGAALVNLLELVRELGGGDLIDVQERYVALFDRSRGLSLHIFEHVHGDSRERGQAMVDLAELYRQAGLVIARAELPDYLPLFLEYLSQLARDPAQQSLRDVAHILAPIQQRLAKRGSAYAAIFAALIRLAEYLPPEAALAEEEPDDTPEALDRAWEEAAVIFGPEAAPNESANAGCSRAATMVARMNPRAR
jgi:nitrate reductase delta subunit